MKYAARPPQRIISEKILERRRLHIWADIGFGKTGATLDALDTLDLVEEDCPTLVVAPLRVAEVTWPDEIQKWDHLGGWRASAVVGSVAAREKALRVDANLFTVNFENVPWLVDRYLKGRQRWPFKNVVFDEATRLQGFRLKQGSSQARALGKIAHVHVNRWINLTGTPAPNGYRGLWGQNWFVDAGERLGRTFSAYEQRWFQRGHEKVELSGGGTFMRPMTRLVESGEREINERLADVATSFNAKEWFPNLKEPIKNVVKVRLPAKARLHYQEMERKFFTEIRGHEIEAVHAGAKSMKLLQMASGAVYDADKAWHHLHDEKLQALRSICMEANGANVLAVYHFKPTLERLLKGFNRGTLIKTAETIRAWNAGKIELGFVHPQSIGHGVSLQDGGSIICHVDQWWDAERLEQINGRVGAMRQMQSGYDRDTFQHYIVAEGTLDEDVLLRHQGKLSVQEALLQAMRHRGA